MECGLAELLAEDLRPCVAFRNSNVNKHPAALQCVNSMLQDLTKNVSLKARQALGDVIEDCAFKNVDSCVD